MDGIGKILLLSVLNFCGLPLLGAGIALWFSRGMPGSPVVLRRRDEPTHIDDFDEEL